MTHTGKCQLECSVNGRNKQCEFYIANSESPPILGLSMCENRGLITRGAKGVETDTTESINSTYTDVCNGLGCFEEPHHIVVKQDTVPMKEPHRRVPFGLQDRLKLKLDLTEKHKIIQKVNKPTDWVHNLVIVEKKGGSLRLCLDPRELNKAIKWENFQIPTVEGVTCRLSGKKVFTVIDLWDSFWQIPLSEESASLTTFNTPFGRYFFKRMPFGLCSASEVIQKRVYQTFGDIDDVHVIADNIIIASNSEEEADRTLIKLFKRAQEKNVKFNIAKLQLKKSEVSYMGNIIGSNGVMPDPSKVEAIVSMREPECKKDIQRLVGMLNYLSQYVYCNSSNEKSIESRRTVRVEHRTWTCFQQSQGDSFHNIWSPPVRSEHESPNTV